MAVNQRAKSRKRRRIFIYSTILLVIIIGIAGWSAGWFSGNNQIVVTTSQSEVRNLFARVTESGSIQPTIDVPVAPDVSGEVVNIAIKEGMKVRKGDLLVTIRSDDYIARLDQSMASLNQVEASQMQAEANVNQLKATLIQDSLNYARNQELFNDSIISKLEYERIETQYKVSQSQLESAKQNLLASYYQVKNAEASLKQARQNLDRTNIYASMDGTITQLNIELGQRVVGTSQMAGTEILKIADLSSMEVVVEINENDIVNVNLGDSAIVEVDAFPNRDFFGKVSEIAYSAVQNQAGTSDQVTNFEVKVIISPNSYQEIAQNKDIPYQEESPFRPGMTALVEIFTQKADSVISVPIQAVTLSKSTFSANEGGKDKETPPNQEPTEVVYIVESDTVREVKVEIGISDDNFIEITSGLDRGKEVVTGPYKVLTQTLRDGMDVKVENQTLEKGEFSQRKSE